MCLDKITKNHKKPVSGKGWKVFNYYDKEEKLYSEYFSNNQLKKGVYINEKDYRPRLFKRKKFIYNHTFRYHFGWHVLLRKPKAGRRYKVIRIRYRGGHTEGEDGTYYLGKTIVATEIMIGGRKI